MTKAMTIDAVDYSTKIPNNVNLAEDRQVLRALESWHPGYIDWWKDMGPEGFQDALVYLRTAVSVDPSFTIMAFSYVAARQVMAELGGRAGTAYLADSGQALA